MRVIWVKVGEKPTIINIPHRLENMQELVGGMIEIVEPFSDNVVLVCNENALAENKPFNRKVNDRWDILGDFFLCGQDATGLQEIPKDKIEFYMQKISIQE